MESWSNVELCLGIGINTPILHYPLRRFSSFRTQRDDRINLQGSPRREVTSGERCQPEKRSNHTENQWIMRIDSIQEGTGQSGGSKGGKQPKTQTDPGQQHALAKHQLQNLRRLRA